MVLDALIRNFEVIGEAAKHIPPDVRNKYPQVQWKAVTGFRDVLIHDYLSVDTDALRLTVKQDLPILKSQLNALLKELEEQVS